MFAQERQKVIKNMIIEQGQVEVSILSQILNVSEVTVRKDLDKLQNDMFLIRTHGGAILKDEQDIDENQELDRYDENLDEIGTTGSLLIEDNDTVILINGEINRNIATKLFRKNNITVVTNDVEIASCVKINSNSKLIVVGGELDLYDKALYGHLAIKSVRDLYIDKLFIEIDGISSSMDYTCKNPNKAEFIRECMKISKEKNLVFREETYKKRSLYRVGSIDEISKVLTSIHSDSELKNKLFKYKISIHTPVNIFEGGSVNEIT
ncbi:MAG: DeoR/GlpR family DNA-binding transcription regulator [Lachnospirales bacterium]